MSTPLFSSKNLSRATVKSIIGVRIFAAGCVGNARKYPIFSRDVLLDVQRREFPRPIETNESTAEKRNFLISIRYRTSLSGYRGTDLWPNRFVPAGNRRSIVSAQTSPISISLGYVSTKQWCTTKNRYDRKRKRLGSRTVSFTELQEYPLAVYRNHRSRFAWMTSRRGTRRKRRERRIVVVCVERTQEAKRVRERKVLGKEIRVYGHRKNEIEGELEARSVSFGIQNAEKSEERVESE